MSISCSRSLKSNVSLVMEDLLQCKTVSPQDVPQIPPQWLVQEERMDVMQIFKSKIIIICLANMPVVWIGLCEDGTTVQVQSSNTVLHLRT
jgi:hypothetical protein